jgi:hypothetical protein
MKRGKYFRSVDYLRAQLASSLLDQFSTKKHEDKKKKNLKRRIAYDDEVAHLVEVQIEQLPDSSFRPYETAEPPKKPFVPEHHKTRVQIKNRMKNRRK